MRRAATGGVALSEALPDVVSPHPLAPLHDPATTRARCAAILRAVEQDLSPSFKLDRGPLAATADRVAALMLRRWPALDMAPGSCWSDFAAGGVDARAQLEAHLAGHGAVDLARAQADLAVVSVLLGGSADARWQYTESTPLSAAALPQAAPEDLLALLDQAASARPREDAAPSAPHPQAAPAQRHQGSAGLAVASFHAFMAGAFATTAGQAQRADAAALRHVDVAALRAIFQSSPANPLSGLEGRATLLARLGATLQQEAAHDLSLGLPAQARPALLFDRLTGYGTRHAVRAVDVLGEVLRSLTPIWPTGRNVQSLPAGDVWPHLWAGATVAGGAQDRTTEGWVPLHGPSLRLTHALLEPLRWAGVGVSGLDALTALPDARNGALLVDIGVLVPRDPRLLQRSWKLQDELVIEWRALTLALLDELAVLVRLRLGKTATELPLAGVLECGLRAVGCEIAKELRAGGSASVRVEDGDAAL